MTPPHAPMLKRSSTIFLQAVIVFLGIGALALLLWEPQVEGVNAQRTNVEIYFTDPFLAVVYLGAVPFFIALYQAFTVLGYVRRNTIFSEGAVKAIRTIKYCAIAIIGFVVVEEVFILSNTSDDRAGGLFMGLLITFGSIVIATAAAMVEQVLGKAVEMKSENDLTV